MPADLEAEVLQPQGTQLRCALCRKMQKAGHKCSLGVLSVFLIAALGLYFMPKPVFQAAPAAQQQKTAQVAGMCRSLSLLCLSLAQLPGEGSWSETLTCLGTSQIPDISSIQRRPDGSFRQQASTANAGRVWDMPVRYLPSQQQMPPKANRSSGHGPCFMYVGVKCSGAADSGEDTAETLGRMESTIRIPEWLHAHTHTNVSTDTPHTPSSSMRCHHVCHFARANVACVYA